MLYSHMNGVRAEIHSINMMETSLTGNQAYSTMKKSKTAWKGVDDDTIVPPVFPADKSDFVIALPRQRIRSFYIEYIPFEQKQSEQE
jgi:hypothetical protein